jgi:MoaA/NifB/PqqE/SkfB family radical SAM enzyme
MASENKKVRIDITYRGPLASCDYACDYCPFAKRHDDAKARHADESALNRFVDWVEAHQGEFEFRILITPWGEALVRKWYRQAIVRLSHLPHVAKVVIQTNLSTPVTWLEDAQKDRVALWTTYHPSEISIERFVAKTQALEAIGIEYSVGIVGKNENQIAAARLRKALNPATYLWINAYKDDPLHYSDQDIEYFTHIDPHFGINNQYHQSFQKECNSGVTSISIDGNGDVKPCHFVDKYLGNIYEDNLQAILQPCYQCPNAKCGCYIGYIHLPELGLNEVYGEKLLERIVSVS